MKSEKSAKTPTEFSVKRSLGNNCAGSNATMPTQPKRRMKLWKKILIISISLLVALPIIAYGLIFIAFSGGIANVIRDLKPAPDPTSANVTEKRQATVGSLEASIRALDERSGFVKYGTSTHDACYEGQNNYKVEDGFAHRCDYRMTSYYGFDGDFRERAVAFEEMVIGAGWGSQDQRPFKMILENYYDVDYGSTGLLNFPKGYFVSDLPKPSYLKDTQRLEVELAENRTTDLLGLEYIQNVSSSGFGAYDKSDFQDIPVLFKTITSKHQYVIVLSIQETYFEN